MHRGYCDPCYQRKRHDGSLLILGDVPVEQRFWDKVEKLPGAKACWLWRATTALPGGYGAFWDGQKMRRSHVFAWELENWPVPKGLHICHRCDNPPCVRPSHLFPGTDADNLRDAWAKDRMIHGERCSWSKLSEADVRCIRRSWAWGIADANGLAVAYGVSEACVRKVVTRQTWRRVA